MSMIRSKLFNAEEQELLVYNQKAILNETIEFYTVDDCQDEETDYNFPGYVSSYLRIYNERLGTLMRTVVLSQSGGSLVINASVADMTFDPSGVYWYEIGYSNGYDIVLRYGPLQVI
jgi:hypothetical protein